MKLKHLNLKIRLLTLSSVAILGLSTGCTHTLSANITNDGRVASQDIVFPELNKAWQKDGQFPNTENLQKIRAGVSKDELYQLIGRPHFSEGQHAREWDYILKFYQPDDSVKICQYKVIFDKDYKGQEFYWLPADCAKFAQAPEVVATPPQTVIIERTPVQTEKINLAADALFAFDKWRLEDMKSEGREALDELALKLRQYQHMGDTRIIITGYTDRLGEDMYNLNLSQLRAQTVRSYLITKGVEASTMTAAGAGEGDPVVQCDDGLGRQMLIQCLQPNRRVEVAVSIFK